MTTLAQVNEDFDRILGDTWQPTMPEKPEPMPKPAAPIAEWPTKDGGREL